MILLYHYWDYIQRSVSQNTIEIPAPHVYCSTIDNSQVLESA
jgi:hypothetical protein